jgi:2-polyprenyl-3-methyl-5-hydroxy-6-metoxy-1,4-benzoquinol methylase
MTISVYDQMGNVYYDFVQRELAAPQSVLNLGRRVLLERAGDVRSIDICDLACGEGHLARTLAERGARVTGIDLSSNLLAHARRQSQGTAIKAAITYVQDDAQTLSHLSPSSFDLVISNLAFMDIPQYEPAIRAVHRVLRQGGRFLFSLLHPCFETPFHVPEKPVEADEEGNFVACRIMRYAEEGWWTSGTRGLRGTHGAYHRTLSTYTNTLIAAGFAISHLAEPLVPASAYTDALIHQASKLPRVLLVEARKQ